MKRQISLITILLTLLASCWSSVDTRFGFARFSFMAYNWRNATATSHFLGHSIPALRTVAVDTPMAVVVERYVQVNDSGMCSLARSAKWGGPLEYALLPLPLSCDTILRGVERQPFAAEYLPPDGYVEIYDGPAFCILIERKDGSRLFIEYHHAFIPEALKPIHSFLYEVDSPTFTEAPLALDMQEVVDSIGRRDANELKEFMSKATIGAPVPVPDP